MPRTAVFFDRLDKAFDEKQCLITLESLEDIRGGLLKVGESKKPYGCDALLKWYDHNPLLPHSRAPLEIDDMHPVMTNHTRMEDYAHAVRVLGERGWDHAAEVEEDTARRGHKRGHDDAWDVAPIDAMREGLSSSSWWLFTHTENKREALRHIDQRFMGPVFEAEKARPDLLRRIVALFITHRERMLAFPPGERPLPIYLNLRDLANQISDIYEGATVEQIEDQIRVLVGEEEGEDRPHRIASIEARPEEDALVLNAPDVVTWIRGFLLPQVHDNNDGLRWWRVPNMEGEVIERLYQLRDGKPLRLNISDLEMYESMSRCFREIIVYEYRRPVMMAFRMARNDAEMWLLHNAIPLMDARGDERTYHPALWHALEISRERGAECPFSIQELRSAIRRQYESSRCTMYSLDDDEIREDPTLLPSDPYTNPRLLTVLRHNLGRMDAEARDGGGARVALQ